MLPKGNGFTLVELLVAIALITLISTFGYTGYTTLREDQALKKVALDFENRLREVQTNATSNLKCNSYPAKLWAAKVTQGGLESLCQYGENLSFKQKSYIIEEANIALEFSCDTINFAPLSGAINFSGPPTTSCDLSQLIITLTNNKTGSAKEVIIDKGGAIGQR